jgi:hypothetical protein
MRISVAGARDQTGTEAASRAPARAAHTATAAATAKITRGVPHAGRVPRAGPASTARQWRHRDDRSERESDEHRELACNAVGAVPLTEQAPTRSVSTFTSAADMPTSHMNTVPAANHFGRESAPTRLIPARAIDDAGAATRRPGPSRKRTPGVRALSSSWVATDRPRRESAATRPA